jgi:prevent-host-death family protein
MFALPPVGIVPCNAVPPMDVSVRELRNHTRRVIAAVESGEPVVLTVRGRPVADIVPRRARSERRPTELLLADLGAIADLAGELDVASDPADFDTGLTTDDMVRD